MLSFLIFSRRRVATAVAGRGALGRPAPPREKIAGYFFSYRTQDTRTMDAERINLIGTTLQDLALRTQELRRYL